MSASERLRALEGRMGDGLISYELEEVLPQIRAVVEAAERAALEAHQGRVPDRARPILRREVTPALAALDQALDEE